MSNLRGIPSSFVRRTFAFLTAALRAARNAVRLPSNSPGKSGKTKVKNPGQGRVKLKLIERTNKSGNLPSSTEKR